MTNAIPQTNPRASYHAHKAEIDAALARVMEGGRYILGPEVAAFESAFAAFVWASAGRGHAVGVANGTDALTLALRACGVGPDDVVVAPSHTAGATIAAIELAGAMPLFVDIDPATFTLDPNALAAALARPSAGVNRAAIRAVVAVHLYGQLCDMPAITGIAAREDLIVIEDCAQAHGATLDGRAAGTWGAAAAFSFYPTKNLGAFGDGGAVVTADSATAERLRALREYGWRQRYVSSEPGPDGRSLGMNSRLDELQAAVLGVKLPHLHTDNARRAGIAARYDAGLRAADLVTPPRRPGAGHVFHQYVIRCARRDDLRASLQALGIGTLIHYPVPVHLQPAYQGRVPVAGALAHTEAACREILSLPMFPELADADVERVVAGVAGVVGAAPRSPAISVPASRPPAHAAAPAPAVAPAAPQPAPTCIFINTYYAAFLEAHYRRQPELIGASYAQQKASLQATCFGDSDFYSQGLKQAGWVADDIIANCGPLQSAWAREADVNLPDYLDVLVEQLRRLRPQVIYLQDLSLATPAILARLRPLCELLVGQIASPVPPQADAKALDIIFTSFPHFAERFRQSGITAYYQPLAFDPRVLDLPPTESDRHSLTFVGGISPHHPAGTELLTALANALPIEIYGYGADSLPEDSRVRARHLGEAWGAKMFGLLRASGVTVNRHIAVAEDNANNMRLYEATGCGALLITDYKTNLGQLFEIGKEVVAYRTPEECVALCQYYLAHPEQAAAIARAGQQRTLRDHTYARRMRDTAEILARHLRLERQPAVAQPPVDLGAISTGYAPLSADAVTTQLTDAWKDDTLPGKQRALVTRELGGMYKGSPVTPFEVLARALRPLLARHPSAPVLEIGCASGYYREVLRYLLGQPVDYTGVDYSPAMIDMAVDYYPQGKFLVGDGAKLPFGDQSFPIVVSSCVLLHVPNYHQHIRETARVAGRVVVAHRTPVCRARKTHHLRKKGYGVDMVELRFNEGELVSLLAESGLTVVSQQEFHADPQRDEYGVTYVCQRAGQEMF